MDRKEIVNSQEYKATKAAIKWWYSLPEEQRKTTDIDAEPDIVDAYAEGVIYGWNNPHWIPVEERLPPKMGKYSKRSNDVLVVTERKELFMAKYWYDGDGWAVNGFPTSKLTHWMEIVPPRKEE